MKKIILVLIFALTPVLSYAFTASDFKVNNQSTYAIPQGTTKVLILDLTLPAILKSIKLENAGTALQTDITRISIFEDGASAGWSGDEKEIIVQANSPFWDTWLSGNFSKTRIFITADIAANAVSTRTIQPQIKINAVEFASGSFGPTDQEILGLKRTILAGASSPTVPVAPIAGISEAISATTIRWHFTDLSNNEFGFKILDANLKEVARNETANLFYLDEAGLQPNTEYSGRRVVAFNDRGENLGSAVSVFSAVATLSLPPVEVVKPATTTEEVVTATTTEQVAETEKPVAEMTIAEINAKIAEILAQIESLRGQLTTDLSCAITSFDRNLKQGMSGSDVKCLQIILNSSADTKITVTGEGSLGKETTYFGSLTRAAVIKFQEKYASEILTPLGLNKGTGFVFSATRIKLNELLKR